MAKMILVEGFCTLQIKITQFPGGFGLNNWSPKVFADTHVAFGD